MSTLKEKFAKAEINEFEITWLSENGIVELEKIADDYAISFAEWITNEKSKYAIMYGNQEKRFATFSKDCTTKELLEIFKKENGY
jgi:hypothetical protein